MKFYQYLSAAAVAAIVFSQASVAGAEEPVMVDPSLGAKACVPAKVINIKSYLSVRSGPSTLYGKVESLSNGDQVYVCDESDNGWLGVIFPYFDGTCELSASKSGAPYPYQGDCIAGWVSGQYIDELGGY